MFFKNSTFTSNFSNLKKNKRNTIFNGLIFLFWFGPLIISQIFDFFFNKEEIMILYS